MGFIPELNVKYGSVQGYGGPGYDWARVVGNNRVLFESKGGATGVAVDAERARVKWEGPWNSEDDFLAAIVDLPLEYPLCSNCNLPIGKNGSYCLDNAWCDREECRKALERARQDYEDGLRAWEKKREEDDRRRKAERLAQIEHDTRCFHWRDGWYFRRLEDGSVRVMHRSCPSADYLQTDITIPPDSWASIICAVSKDGETAQRWQEAQDFHGSV